MITLKNLSVSFGRKTAVDHFSTRFSRGKTSVLIGPSGCGKSTLLRVLTGLVWPSVGSVRINGKLLTDVGLRSFRQRLGYVIQDGGLFPHLTARENVALAARHLGWNHDSIAHRIVELTALVRLDSDRLDCFPSQLSGGQQQRVSLMRALMLDPDLLLLDEPLGALDPMIRADLQTDLHAIFAQLGKTVIMVTHDLAEAAWFADRIFLLRDGHLVQEGTAEDLTDRPSEEFVTTFVSAQRRIRIDGGQAS